MTATSESPGRTQIVVMGRRFETITFDSVDAANAFMLGTPGWGVIQVDNDRTPDMVIHLARMDDKGTPAVVKPKALKRVAQKRSEYVPHLPDMASLERDLAKVERRLRKLGHTDAYLSDLSKHFHLGRVGGSGRNTARLNRRREAALDKSIREAGLINRLRGQRNYLLSCIEKHKTGTPS